MKKHSYLSTGLTAGAFFLIGALAVAQTSQSKTVHPREASSGQATGIAVDHAGGNGVQHADTGKSGENPLYEGKSLTNVKPGVGASAAPYKDPEDMTTRYRAGNNKTTRSAGDNPASTASPQATGLAHKKHVAGVKYEDRTAPAPGNTPATSGRTSKVDSFSVKQ